MVVLDNESGCACGVNGTCKNKQKLCNCDEKTSVWAEDFGYLTEKKYLPVTRLRVTGIADDSAFVYIGPLECFGNANAKGNSDITPRSVLDEVCMSVRKKNALLEIANNSSLRNLEKEEDLPILPSEITNSPDNIFSLPSQSFSTYKPLGVLEIIVISFAGLAVIILIVKFICLDKFCKRNDRGELILNQVGDCSRDEQLHESEGTSGVIPKNGTTNGKKITRNPLSAYWV